MLDFLGYNFSHTGAAGTLSLLLALAFALVALVSGVLAGRRGDERLTEMARYATWGNFAFMTAAIGLLQFAILTDDFSVRYVANHSMTVSPLWVKWVTLWAALEGSILLWAWILSLYAFLVSLTARREGETLDDFVSRALPPLLGVSQALSRAVRLTAAAA